MVDGGGKEPEAADLAESALDEEIARQKGDLGLSSIWAWLPGLLLFGLLIVFVARFSEFEQFLKLAADADPRWLLAGIVAQALTYVCAGGVWWLALQRAGRHLPLGEFAPLGLAKLFADQAIPTGGASGTLLVTAGLRNRGIPLRLAFFAMLVEMFSYYAAYFVAAAVGFAVLFAEGRLGVVLAIAFALFTLVTVAVPLGAILMKVGSKRHPPAWVMKFKMARFILVEVAEAPLRELVTFRLLAGTFTFQIAIFLLDTATLWFAFRSVGVTIEPLVVLTGLAAGQVGATIGPVPLGLGTFEGAAIGVFSMLGVSVEPALMAVVLFRGLSFWLPMLPGLWFARRELNRTEKDAAASV